MLACAAPRFDCLALVKPQFEVGRERVGKGGVVRSADDRRAALVEVGEHARASGSGVAVLGYASLRPARSGGQPRELRLARRGGRGPAPPATSRPRREGPSRDAPRARSPSSATRGSATRAGRCDACSSSRARRGSRCAPARGGGEARLRLGAGRRVLGERPTRTAGSRARARRRRHDPVRAARFRRPRVPVFAVNFGAIGFLATVEPWELEDGMRARASPATST